MQKMDWEMERLEVGKPVNGGSCWYPHDLTKPSRVEMLLLMVLLWGKGNSEWLCRSTE